MTGEMAAQELSEELKAPWLDKYISEYQEANNNFDNEAESIEQVMIGPGVQQHDEKRQEECESSNHIGTRLTHSELLSGMRYDTIGKTAQGLGTTNEGNLQEDKIGGQGTVAANKQSDLSGYAQSRTAAPLNRHMEALAQEVKAARAQIKAIKDESDLQQVQQ